VSTRHPEIVLERMAEHVAYELRMIGSLMHAEVGDAGELATLALDEAFLLHVRTVSSFLAVSSRRAWPDDVVADDYFRGPHPPFSPLTPDDRRDIEVRLAHLTTDRLGTAPADRRTAAGPDRSYWGRQVLREFGHFVDALAVESPGRAAWFEPALTEAKRSSLPRVGAR
jgi:hypothetical protein